MHNAFREMRAAVRSVTRAPWLTAAIVISTGLGVGANATVFAWMDTILRHPFPAIEGGHALVAINGADGDGMVRGMPPIAVPTLEAWRARATSFTDIAGHAPIRLNLRETTSALGKPVWAQIVTPNYFTTLRVTAAVGRVFTDRETAIGQDVVVLSHAFWRRRFGGRGDIVGRSLLFNGVPLTVIGVLPRDFGGVIVGLHFEAWIPLWRQPQLTGIDWSRDRSTRRLQGVARLTAAATIDGARAELLRLARIESREAGEVPIRGAAVRWVADTQLGSLMGPLSPILTAVAAIVLLAASANVSGLLLARAAASRRQFAIQVALGASRARLLRESLLASLLLALAGAGAGVVVAFVTKGALTWVLPRIAEPVSLNVNLNWRVHLFAIGTAVVAGLLFGIVPAWRSATQDAIDAIRTRHGDGGGGRLRTALVVLQVAFSVVALTTAGILTQSVWAAGSVPLGFGDPRRILLLSTELSFTGQRDAALQALADRWMDAVRAMPEVKGATLASAVPLGFGGAPQVPTAVEGYLTSADEMLSTGRVVIADDYFAVMSMPLIAGRATRREDGPHSRRIVVVNRAFADRFWPRRSALGGRINQGDGWAEIVGVVENARMDSLNEPIRPLAFVPLAQTSQTAVTLHVATVTPGALSIDALRRTTAAVHPDLPLLDPGTLADHIAAATFIQAAGARTLASMGAIAMFLAATGLYGLLAALVEQRRRELAVRIALGAGTRDIASSVARPAVQSTALGISIGTVAAVVAARLLQNQMPGTSGPAALAAPMTAAALLLVVGAAACVGPIIRARRIDPCHALKH